MSEQTHELEPAAAGEQDVDDVERELGAAETGQADADGLGPEGEPDGDGDAELTPDDDLELDDVDDAEPPAPDQPSQAEIEATYKKLDKETERHVKRVAELVGEEAFAMLVGCELCEPSMPGFRWPRPPADHVKEAVRFAIGDRQPENWQADTYSRKCDACDGLGEVLTGSHVRGQETLGCLACESRGWIAIGPERSGRPVQSLRVVEGHDQPQLEPAAPVDDPPEVAQLRAAGYVVIKTTPAE